MMSGFGFLGIFFMLIFWVLLILAAVWLVKSLFGSRDLTQSSRQNQSPNAREILDQRYARGELTREQYEQMRADLNQV
ncbi:MAG: SHOCT domain-containing protein [Anaerolineales bacterium]|nr:MAG: SHOCT domain-containing protein [Anaerolineales bacterium]